MFRFIAYRTNVRLWGCRRTESNSEKIMSTERSEVDINFEGLTFQYIYLITIWQFCFVMPTVEHIYVLNWLNIRLTILPCRRPQFVEKNIYTDFNEVNKQYYEFYWFCYYHLIIPNNNIIAKYRNATYLVTFVEVRTFRVNGSMRWRQKSPSPTGNLIVCGKLILGMTLLIISGFLVGGTTK